MKNWVYSTAFSVWDEEEHDAIDRVMQSNKCLNFPVTTP